MGPSNCTIQSDVDFASVIPFQNQIPEFDGLSDSDTDVQYRGKHLEGIVFKAFFDEKLAGILFAYREKELLWYNHITAVSPQFRKRGIASSLLHAFEQHTRLSGGEICTVKSMNRFPSMLRLLIKEKYQIVGVEGEKILFRKEL